MKDSYSPGADSSFILTDGARIGVFFRDFCVFSEGYTVTNTCINHEALDVAVYGGADYTISGRSSAEVTLTMHNPSTMRVEDGAKRFSLIEAMSVNELLAAAFKKMNDRAA